MKKKSSALLKILWDEYRADENNEGERKDGLTWVVNFAQSRQQKKKKWAKKKHSHLQFYATVFAKTITLIIQK